MLERPLGWAKLLAACRDGGESGGQWRDLEACWGGLGLLLCCVCALLWPSGRLGASASKRLDIGRRVLGQWSDVCAWRPRVSRLRGERVCRECGGEATTFLCADL